MIAPTPGAYSAAIRIGQEVHDELNAASGTLLAPLDFQLYHEQFTVRHPERTITSMIRLAVETVRLPLTAPKRRLLA